MKNHLLGVPFTPNQQGTHERRDQVLSNVGAQNMDTGGCQVSHLDDVEFYCECGQLDVDAVFRPGIHTLFSPTMFEDVAIFQIQNVTRCKTFTSKSDAF